MMPMGVSSRLPIRIAQVLRLRCPPLMMAPIDRNHDKPGRHDVAIDLWNKHEPARTGCHGDRRKGQLNVTDYEWDRATRQRLRAERSRTVRHHGDGLHLQPGWRSVDGDS